MDPEEPPTMTGRIFWWLGGCLCAVLLYIGSVGPVVFLLPMGHGERYPLLEKFYAPVGWLVTNTPFGKPIEAYVEWCASRKGDR